MDKYKKKKSDQLGMNVSTASGRLRKNILFHLVKELGRDKCYRCGEVTEIDDFSIEHKVPWLDSENPKELFFDLNNITFSHQKCNYSAARRGPWKYNSDEERRLAKNEMSREYHHENKTKRNKQSREYYSENRDKLKEYRKDRWKKFRK